MPDRKPPYTAYNRYFLLPVGLWALIGGLLLALFSRRQLFAAVNLRHQEWLDSMMFTITNLGDGLPIIAILLLLVAVPKFRNCWYALAAVACNAVPALVVQALKETFKAARPFEYYKADNAWIHYSDTWGDHLLHNSFPSGHSAGAFSLFCFLALLLPRRYQPWGIALFGLALAVGYSRMYLAAHFFADVYAGSLIGTAVTAGVFALLRRFIPRFYGTHEAAMAVVDN